MMKYKNIINGCEYSDDGKILIRAALCYTSIVVPEGVECIAEKAFYNVTTLQKIQLPTTLLKIGVRAFCGCRNLKELNIPSGTNFPSDNPRYTICVTTETKDTTSDGKNISETVNKLSEYLNKH